jgi:hypothetical protein
MFKQCLHLQHDPEAAYCRNTDAQEIGSEIVPKDWARGRFLFPRCLVIWGGSHEA